jgi:hypothetical protein
LAFGLALILDELSRHLPEFDDELRARILAGCGRMFGEP